MPDVRPSLAIVIPAHNASAYLERVIPAAQQAANGSEVLVVDDGSTDSTGLLAGKLGARVIQLPRRAGPAEARNVGAAQTEAIVVLFLDADCVAHPDVGRLVRRAFADDPELVSLTGSYDSEPADRGFFSQYMNLRHHFTHQTARKENATFWAGCGAVRRSVFLELHGFDSERYPRPEIEDIELGLRLAERGHTRLDPTLQVTHLKAWTVWSLIATDVRKRAIPWARLILERGTLPNDLNLRASQRLAASVAPLALVSVCVLPIAAAVGAWGVLALALAIVLLSLALNWEMLRAFARLRGLRFALAAWSFHQVHLLYSAITFFAVSVVFMLRGRRGSVS